LEAAARRMAVEWVTELTPSLLAGAVERADFF
jgi:hypothetical protein